MVVVEMVLLLVVQCGDDGDDDADAGGASG